MCMYAHMPQASDRRTDGSGRHPLDKAKRGAVSFRICWAALKEQASVARERGEAEEAQAGLQAARQVVMAARRRSVAGEKEAREAAVAASRGSKEADAAEAVRAKADLKSAEATP